MTISEIRPNVIFQSDCLTLLERLTSDSATLVYIDPPFFTSNHFFNQNQSNEKDNLANFDEYLDWLSKVLNQAYRITTNVGTIVIHTEPRINSYVRLISEELFREMEFSEIILRSPKRFHNGKKPVEEHETLLYCRKSADSIWNPPMRPLSAEEMKYRYSGKDEQGRRYAMTPLTYHGERPNHSYEWKGFKPRLGHSWRFSFENMEKLYSEGRIFIPDEGKRPYLKSYADEASEIPIGTTWDDLSTRVHPNSLEKTEYVAQQPLALMERVIQSSSNEGDLVIDPLCGSGSTLLAAQTLNRKWIGGDSSELACKITQSRFQQINITNPANYNWGDEQELKQFPVIQSVNSTVFKNVLRQHKIRFVQNNIVRLEETRHYEFKEIKGANPVGSIENTADEYAIAFLNSEGGRVYWGIRNEDRVIVGVSLDYRQRDEVGKAIDNKLKNIQPPISPSSWRYEFHQVYDESGKPITDLYVVELIVPRSQQSNILFGTSKGEVFLKTDSGKQKLSFTEWQQELIKRQGNSR